MDVQIDKPASYLRKMSVTVPAGTVDAAFDKAYREVGKSANIPGFRPGKAPKSLIEMHYGSQVRSEVQQRLVTETLFKAIDEVKENPVHMPKVEPGELSRGKAFAYTAEFEVQPEIKLTKYKKLAAPTVSAEVTDAELDAQLEELRKQSSQLVPVMIRDTAQKGDVLVIDYEGTMGGSPIPGGRGENALLEIGGESYLPGLAEGLEGAKVPSERSVQVTFPDDFSNAELAGKPATFNVKVKELKTKEMPKLDDEFAKDMGEESLAKLRERMKADMQARKDQDAHRQPDGPQHRQRRRARRADDGPQDAALERRGGEPPRRGPR
jgi:trigger factor